MWLETIIGSSIFIAALLFYLIYYLFLTRHPREKNSKMRHNKMEQFEHIGRK